MAHGSMSMGCRWKAAHRLDVFAESLAVVVACVCQGLVKADVLRGPLGDLVHLVAALLGLQLLPEVLQAEDDRRIIACHAVQGLLHQGSLFIYL